VLKEDCRLDGLEAYQDNIKVLHFAIAGREVPTVPARMCIPSLKKALPESRHSEGPIICGD
jgi:hypothetical protein